MGLEDVPSRNTELQTGSAHRGGDGFWKSLQGLLTAAAGFVAAITALIVGLDQADLINRESPAPVALYAAGGELEYKVGKVSDGFAWVRRAPTVSSDGLVQLPTGTRTMCSSHAVDDSDNSAGRTWRYCSHYKGFVSARLLMPVER